MMDFKRVKENIIQAIEEAGIPAPDEILIDGEIHRFSTNDRPSDKAGWYVFFSYNNFVAGSFGDWRTGIKETFHSREIESLSPKDRSIIRQKQEEITRKIQCKQEEAKKKAVELYSRAQPPDPNHPYLVRKKIEPIGEIKQLDNALIIPLWDINKNINGLQFIHENGEKIFLKGSSLKEHFFRIGSDFPLYICEGYATGVSIYKAIEGEGSVIIAFNAGNLKSVAKVFRNNFPNADIIICSDNDRWTKGNPGVTKAIETAKEVLAKIAIPHFKDTSTKPTDFNDLLILEGVAKVREQLKNAKYPIYTKDEREKILNNLTLLPPIESDLLKKKVAKILNVKLSSLDEEIKRRRKNIAESEDTKKKLLVEELEPWDKEVNGQELVKELTELIKSYVRLSNNQALTCALWLILTYAYDLFPVLPILTITSPEKRCGKTTLLLVLSGLVKAPIIASNISPSAVYRVVEKYKPCLLIDEGDTFIKDNEPLRGVINSGHTKNSAYVVRVNQETLEPEKFSTWCPKAIALIGDLPDTIRDRSINIKLVRKLTTEKIKRLSLNFNDKALPYRQKILRWVIDNEKELKERFKSLCDENDIPDVGNDRAMDNWSPLLAIADVVGYGKEAREAMLTIENVTSETLTIHQELLLDIRDITKGKERITSRELVDALVNIEDRPWSEWRRGKPLTPSSLARLLKPFDIYPKQMRIGNQNCKGYEVKDFEEIFKRYLPYPSTPNQTETMKQSNNFNRLYKKQNETQTECVSFQNSDNILKTLNCFGVSVEKHIKGEDKKIKDDQVDKGRKVKTNFDDLPGVKIQGDKVII